MGTHKDNQGN